MKEYNKPYIDEEVVELFNVICSDGDSANIGKDEDDDGRF